MKIVGIAQKGTEFGITRIRDLVQDTIDFVYLEGWQKSDWEAGRLDREAPGYDGILAQCITHIPDEFRSKTVLFGLGSANRRIMDKPHIAQRIKDIPLAGYWVNNNTVAQAVKKATGIEPKVMYRANDVVIPEDCPAKPRNRYILWYASEWNGCLKPYKDKSKAVIEALKEHKIKVFVAPHQQGWSCNKSHAIGLGKTNFTELMPTLQGMVRFGEIGDFGRSTYDFIAQGKWVLGHDVDEPFMESVHPEDSVEAIVEQIAELVDDDPEDERQDRWMYAKKYLSPKAMSKNWTKSLTEIFEHEI